MTVANNDSSCVTGGFFAAGLTLPAPTNVTERLDGDTEEFVSLGLLDFGTDAKLQWSTRGAPMQEVLGVRSRGRVSVLWLRLSRDGDGTLRGYWRQDPELPWNPVGPPVRWELAGVRVGLFAANCGPFGNATVDFDY
eukprot:3045002-Rhodomonas_salina.3